MAEVPAARPALDFSTVKQIGRFGLIRELARGGMGQVFLARDTKLGRKVAIKFLLRDEPSFVARFLVEARATARCTHENIVTIYEVGEHLGLPFMVLEYLEGQTLSQLLEQKFTARAFAEIMVPVVRALERAHEHGIVHRDLKPSNIFVTDRGVVRVLDFGVAKWFDAADVRPTRAFDAARATPTTASMDIAEPEPTYVTFSQAGSIIGTVPYMSPEQWGADAVDQLSDLWAVGIMFWRALASVHPAGTMAPDKLRERLTDLATPLPSLAARVPGVPPALAAIVDRCLAKPKAARYQTASELLADLQAFLSPHEVRTEECPYRGLSAFGEDDARVFFGRAPEIRTALASLRTWPLLAVVGPSGVGKSSFVHAGLLPAIRNTGAWDIRVVRPGRAPIANLAGTLDRHGIHPAAFAAALHGAPGTYGEALREQAASTGRSILVVVDQLEELFTLSDDESARRTFLAALLAAADDASTPVRIVLSMRADFLDRLAGHQPFLAELSRGLCFLSAPDRDSLRETLTRPAELAGYAFEDPAIVDQMMQIATSRGALPLLQFAATRLWDRRDRTRKLLTRAAYDAMGGVGGAFARHADEIAAAVPQHQQALLRAVLLRLVTPEGTRAVVDQHELASLGERGEVNAILDLLVRGRLVHLHTDPVAGATCEIVHEVLITEWPTLRRWLEDSHALRGFVDELRTAAKQWAARGKPRDLIWRGATAAEAIALASRHVLPLAAGERELLDAIRREQRRGKQRRFGAFIAICALLGVVLAVGSIAYLRVVRAERAATQQAAEAAVEARRAREAERAAKQALQALERSSQVANAAEQSAAEAKTKMAQVQELSREELERANGELRTAADKAERERAKAQQAATAAATAAEQARSASAEARAANTKLGTLLEAEKQRVKQLQSEMSKIAQKQLK